ncbi:hypothetical protein BVX99_01215 [bacterium F16]|nr:hypothetical protein BVX99_01215 [bacterium F16]
MFTESLAINIVLFIVGLAVLVKGSGWFIDGAAFVAKRLKIPDAIIGLTLVSIGTSLPELATNIYAAGGEGKPGVAMGGIPGSNVSNILLVLGLTVCCLKTVDVNKILFHKDTMMMVFSFVVFAVMCYAFPIYNSATNMTEPGISRIESVILLAIFVVYMIRLLRRKDDPEAKQAVEAEEEKSAIHNLLLALVALVGGGVMVGGGANVMVSNVVWIAEVKLHISPAIVAATIIAVGTSVPELAVTFAGILKKKNDIALGNIIGSSIFNLIFVMGVTGLVAEIPFHAEAAMMIMPAMLISGFLLVVFMRTHWALKRWEGVVLTCLFLCYIGVSVAMAMGIINLTPTVAQVDQVDQVQNDGESKWDKSNNSSQMMPRDTLKTEENAKK